MEASQTAAKSMLVRDGVIIAVDSEAESMAAELLPTESIDLQNKWITPMFYDCHVHLLSLVKKREMEVDLSGITSKKQLIDTVKEFIAKKNIPKGHWVIGSGWNQERFSDKVLPNLWDLNQISEEHPIYLVRACYHIAAVNTQALKMAGINQDVCEVSGGVFDRNEQNELTGVVRENAMSIIENSISKMDNKEEMKRSILKGLQMLKEKGIGVVHTDDFSYVDDRKALWEAYCELAKEDKLEIGVVLQLRAESIDDLKLYRALGLKSYERVGKLMIGPIKVIVDGSLGSRTAALEESYSDDEGNYGILIFKKEELHGICEKSFDMGFDFTAHAIGDRAMNMVLDIYQSQYDLYKSKGFTPSIIHCQIMSRSIISRMKELGVVANIQPIFLNTDWNYVENRIGNERLPMSYAWKTMCEKGIICVGSSDAPVEDFSPLYNIYSAVTRRDLTGEPQGGWMKEEVLDPCEAMKLFTVKAASFSRDNGRGSLSKDKNCDFIVWNEDLSKIDRITPDNYKIEEIYIMGKKVL